MYLLSKTLEEITNSSSLWENKNQRKTQSINVSGPLLLLGPGFCILAWFTTRRASADCECLHYAKHFLPAQTSRDQSMSIPIPSANQCHSLSNKIGSNRKALFLGPCMRNQLGQNVWNSHIPHCTAKLQGSSAFNRKEWKWTWWLCKTRESR